MKSVHWVLPLISAILLFVVSGCGSSKDASYVTVHTPSRMPSDPILTFVPSEEESADGNATTMNRITEVTLLVLYNDEAATVSNGDIEANINRHVAMANTIYSQSGVSMQLRVVKIQHYTIDNTVTSPNALLTVASDKNIAALREVYRADEVVLFRDYANDGYCGVAYQNNELNRSLAYAHVTITCPAYVLAHELGHTMGLAHSIKDNAKGRTPYARGYAEENDFATVMAYVTGKSIKINKFSSPDLVCHYSQCGIEAGEEGEADAARSLRETMQTVAGFYQ